MKENVDQLSRDMALLSKEKSKNKALTANLRDAFAEHELQQRTLASLKGNIPFYSQLSLLLTIRVVEVEKKDLEISQQKFCVKRLEGCAEELERVNKDLSEKIASLSSEDWEQIKALLSK